MTREDVLLAGALAEALARNSTLPNMNDEAVLARAVWREMLASEPRTHDRAILTALLASELRNTQGGRNLAGIGLVRDVDDVARFDAVEVVGELDIASWRIAIRH